MPPLTLERYCITCGRDLRPYEVPGHRRAGHPIIRIPLTEDAAEITGGAAASGAVPLGPLGDE